MKTIRASHLSSYLYCQRAWWFQMQAVEPENQQDLSAGRWIHAKHGRGVVLIGVYRTLACIIFLLALITLAVYLTHR